jgi:hypothetical protein
LLNLAKEGFEGHGFVRGTLQLVCEWFGCGGWWRKMKEVFVRSEEEK